VPAHHYQSLSPRSLLERIRYQLERRGSSKFPLGNIVSDPGHNVDAGVKVAECFWEVHHADGDRDDGVSWIASLDFVEDGCSSC